MPKVEIYTTAWCPYCIAAKKLLEQKNVEYSEIPVDESWSLRAAMTKRSRGRRTVPQIFINDEHVGGFDDMAALERRGKLDGMLAV
ncbi:MAG: glutaredoxin 3 [Alphaproteobacteria bacterium]|nr:glutaredoxin 3 [Alphaproteobacteria bacterium]